MIDWGDYKVKVGDKMMSQREYEAYCDKRAKEVGQSQMVLEELGLLDLVDSRIKAAIKQHEKEKHKDWIGDNWID